MGVRSVRGRVAGAPRVLPRTDIPVRVLPDDVYDTLHFSSLAFGGIGAGAYFEVRERIPFEEWCWRLNVVPARAVLAERSEATP